MHPTPSSAFSTFLLVAAALAAVLSPARAQVRFGRHDGSHLPNQDSSGPPEVNAIASGDVDGDGDLDLLYVFNGPGASIRFNDGGTFHRSGTLYAFGTNRVRYGALVDVDGDGDLDAFLAGGGTAYGGGPGPAALLRNDGSGVFTQSTTIPTTAMQADSLEFADLDGDADQDALLVGSPVGVLIWRNDGSGTFTDVTATSFSSTVPSAVRLADRDGDGTDELFGYVGQGYAWFQNNGGGVFSPVGPTGSLLSTGLHFGIADFGGDGDSDLVTSNGVYQNDGTGLLTHVGSVPTFLFGYGLGDAVIADFDGDGGLDVAGTTGAQSPFLWLDTGGFVFTNATVAWFEPHARVPYTIDYSYQCSHAADLDGDGDVDFATGGVEGRNNASTTVGVPPRLFLNTGGQRLVDASRPAFPRLQDVSEAGNTVAMGDVDADGDVDLLLDGNRLWRQDTAGQFGPAEVLPAVGGDACALADVDGDGDLDVLAVRPPLNSGRPELLRNDGSSFVNVTATHLPVATTLGAAVATGDIDGDGDVDAVLGGLSGDGNGLPLLLWRNDGTGHFTSVAAQLPPHAVDAVELQLVDLDGDGDRDLVGVLWHPYLGGPEGMLLFTNNGAGTFTDVTATHLPAVLPRLLTVSDVDGNGSPDLVLNGATLHNDGTGHFTLVGAPQNRITAGGFDEAGGSEDVLEDNVSLTIDGEFHYWGWQVSRRAWIGDLDGDGDRDLVVRCLRGSSYNWSIAFSGVLHNLRRDLRLTALPRLGHECRVQLRAAGNGSQPTIALVAFATSRLPQPVAVAPWGDLHLDLQTAVLFGFASIPDADTAVTLPLFVPPDPVFAGIELTFQALFGPVGNEHLAHFSAAVTHAIVP